MQRAKLFIILGHFLYFDPPNNPKNQNFEKIKKGPGDIIILLKCNINDNHMIYCSWNFNCNRQIFLVIFCYFLPFYPPNSPKNENITKMKITPGYVIIIHRCTKNHDHRLYYSWDMMCAGWKCSFSFWAIFCPFTPLTTRKVNIKKKKNDKNTWRYHNFTLVHQNSWSYTILFLRYGKWQM